MDIKIFYDICLKIIVILVIILVFVYFKLVWNKFNKMFSIPNYEKERIEIFAKEEIQKIKKN